MTVIWQTPLLLEAGLIDDYLHGFSLLLGTAKQLACINGNWVLSRHEYCTTNANFTQFMHFATNHAFVITV